MIRTGAIKSSFSVFRAASSKCWHLLALWPCCWFYRRLFHFLQCRFFCANVNAFVHLYFFFFSVQTKISQSKLIVCCPVFMCLRRVAWAPLSFLLRQKMMATLLRIQFLLQETQQANRMLRWTQTKRVTRVFLHFRPSFHSLLSYHASTSTSSGNCVLFAITLNDTPSFPHFDKCK